MKNSGLFIGRFQPFHLGHVEVINKALRMVCKLTIVIGSAQCGNTWYNPFTSKERMEMIKKTFPHALESKQIKIVALNDIDDAPAWPNYIINNVGQHDMLFSGNMDGVVTLFKKTCPYMDIVMFGGQKICGTAIRETIALHEAHALTQTPVLEVLKEYIPLPALEVIKKVKGVKRIQDIYFNRGTK